MTYLLSRFLTGNDFLHSLAPVAWPGEFDNTPSCPLGTLQTESRVTLRCRASVSPAASSTGPLGEEAGRGELVGVTVGMRTGSQT